VAEVGVCARTAIANAGADGLLLLPPYLVGGPQRGLLSYVRAITEAVDLTVIFYQRGNAILMPETAGGLAAIPGYRRAEGRRGRRREAAPDRAANPGVPTRFRVLQRPADRRADRARLPRHRRPAVSSAVFAFAPEISRRFHHALENGDAETTGSLHDEFFVPLVELRDTSPGFAVPLVKAGVRLRGLDVGPVRAPLLDPGPEHLARLEKLRLVVDGDVVGSANAGANAGCSTTWPLARRFRHFDAGRTGGTSA
jgi:5-dehydro-4-deoxyglucarate dehydratase